MYLEAYNPIKQYNEDIAVEYKIQQSFSFGLGPRVKCVVCVYVCLCQATS
jgi:hypothetical protein